jgi:hypothetical protein
MAQDFASRLFLADVQRVIEAELLKGVEAAIEEAVERVRAEVKSRIGVIACGMLSNYRVERDGPELVIRVDIKGAN